MNSLLIHFDFICKSTTLYRSLPKSILNPVKKQDIKFEICSSEKNLGPEIFPSLSSCQQPAALLTWWSLMVKWLAFLTMWRTRRRHAYGKKLMSVSVILKTQIHLFITSNLRLQATNRSNVNQITIIFIFFPSF